MGWVRVCVGLGESGRIGVRRWRRGPLPDLSRRTQAVLQGKVEFFSRRCPSTVIPLLN